MSQARGLEQGKHRSSPALMGLIMGGPISGGGSPLQGSRWPGAPASHCGDMEVRARLCRCTQVSFRKDMEAPVETFQEAGGRGGRP